MKTWLSSLSRRPAPWLALGAALLFVAHLRWGVGILAWVAPAALLRALRLSETWRGRLAFGVVLAATWIVTTLKIVTGPMPAAAAVMFGLGIAAFQLPAYLVADLARRRAPNALAPLAFPALTILCELAQHRLTELGTWGAAAYTQLDDLPLLQVASVFGMAGVSFLVAWVASAIEAWLSRRLDGGDGAGRSQLAVAVAAVVVAHVFGAARLARPVEGTVKVAAIGTDATFDGHVMPTEEERLATHARLLEDTDRAARSGAKLAVWTEGAALVRADEEDAFVARVAELAARDRIHVVAAYIVPVSAAPLSYENKLQLVKPDGAIDHVYFKHHPVPGEPAVRGRGALPVVDTDVGRIGDALCYDYDFPALAREHGTLGVDLVALPSSDWQGIDPIHTQMAGVRAIEEGFSVLRSTRFGLTAGIDPHGRVRAQRSSFETDDRVVVVDLPRHGAPTLYRIWGDGVAFGLALLLVAATALSTRARATPRATSISCSP